jgi:hypothetical protein
MNPFAGSEPLPDDSHTYESWLEDHSPKLLSGDLLRPAPPARSNWDQVFFKDYLKTQTDLMAARGEVSFWRARAPYYAEMLKLERKNARLQGTLDGRSPPSSLSSNEKTRIILGVLGLAGTLLVAWLGYRKKLN